MKGKGSSKKNVLKVAVPGAEVSANKAPTHEDVDFVLGRKLPPAVSGRVVHAVADAFTPDVCSVLRKPEVSDFYGSRLKPSQVSHDAELARRAKEVAARLQHGAERALQIGAPASIALFEQASLIVRDYDDLIEAHPELEDALAPVYNWWAATFPGGGAKAAKVEEAPAVPARPSSEVKG